MAKTIQERFIEALKAKGETLVKRTHTKIVYSRAEGGYWYIGSYGSLRFGSTITNSIPASVRIKQMLLGE